MPYPSQPAALQGYPERRLIMEASAKPTGLLKKGDKRMIQEERTHENSGVAETHLSPESTQKDLLEREWSLGSGQCPICRGVNVAWHGHPLYTDPGKIGHSTWCRLAAAIKDSGGSPLYVGTYRTEKKFETYWKTFTDLQGLEHRLLESRLLNS